MKPLSGISTIIDHYDALLLDLWGVVHDGSHLYPGVHAVIEKLHAAGKKIIFVSNAPRRAKKVIAVLTSLGVERELYEEAISSGEVGYQWLQSVTPAQAGVQIAGMDSGFRRNDDKRWGKNYYYIGPSKDADILDGLDYRRVDDLKETDFLLNVGFGSEEQSSEDVMPLLRAAKAQQLPMLCLNPDLEVVKQTGEIFPCAGVIARDYERLNGEVKYFGKPYKEIYEWCADKLGKGKILAIGDSISTDIKGACDFGIDSVLVTGGILKKKSADEIEAMCVAQNVAPTFIAPNLSW